MVNNATSDIIVLGAGAAGMMCAIEAGRNGHRVVVIDHAKEAGQKIRISGGGRCNFTNMHSEPKNFLSENPYFAISALKTYSPQDFIEKVKSHGIPYHEKTLGQLFCDNSAKDIIKMLRDEMNDIGAKLQLQTEINQVRYEGNGFIVDTTSGNFKAKSIVVALGGKSIPKMGATGLGYEIAQQFGHKITETRPALVPFTWPAHMVETWSKLSGVAQDVRANCGKGSFDEAMLLTHRGLSGPAMLQISSYWKEGATIDIDLCPDQAMDALLKSERHDNPKLSPVNVLAKYLPKRLAQQLILEANIKSPRIADLNNSALENLSQRLNQFSMTPGGTEGYRTAEVTLGGVDTNGLNQKTMESKYQSGLYFIGEVVDVTGHLGGHNFQWAWASAVAAGRAI
jgi:predicted Rossmann fold flavoprotein